MIIPGASGNRETLCRRMLPAGGRDGAGNRGFGRGEGRQEGSWEGREGGRRGTGEARERMFIDCEARIWPRSRGRLSRGSFFLCVCGYMLRVMGLTTYRWIFLHITTCFWINFIYDRNLSADAHAPVGLVPFQRFYAHLVGRGGC